MNIGLGSLNKIGSNYSMKLNDKDILIVEEDEIHNYKLTQSEKAKKQLLKENEKKRVDEAKNEEKFSPKEEIADAKQIMPSAISAKNPSPQAFTVVNSAKLMELKAEQRLAKEKKYQKEGLSIYTSEMKDALKKEGKKGLTPL